MLDLEIKHGLTYTEAFALISRQMATLVRYAIRAERHGPNSDKGGDEA